MCRQRGRTGTAFVSHNPAAVSNTSPSPVDVTVRFIIEWLCFTEMSLTALRSRFDCRETINGTLTFRAMTNLPFKIQNEGGKIYYFPALVPFIELYLLICVLRVGVFPKASLVDVPLRFIIERPRFTEMSLTAFLRSRIGRQEHGNFNLNIPETLRD